MLVQCDRSMTVRGTFFESTIRRPTTWRTWARKGRDRSQLRKETVQKNGWRYDEFGTSATRQTKEVDVVLWSKVWQKQVDHNLKVAVPMTTCTVMAAETVGASILTGILDKMIG